jgi:hypothetical protein
LRIEPLHGTFRHLSRSNRVLPRQAYNGLREMKRTPKPASQRALAGATVQRTTDL